MFHRRLEEIFSSFRVQTYVQKKWGVGGGRGRGSCPPPPPTPTPLICSCDSQSLLPCILIPNAANSITSTKKNTIIITALSGIVAFSAILVIILLVVVVLMVIKNAKQTKAANVKLHTTPSCIPLTRQETQDSACCSIRTGTNSYI